MKIQSLTSASISEIMTVFNQAFSDYFIPIQFTEESLQSKIKSDHIFLEHSVGVFVENQLVAFILTGIDSKNNELISYNAGTGVIPEFRGQHLPQKMYDYLLSSLHKNNIHKHQLEVITENQKALHVYQKIGYQITKKVSCFKGFIQTPKHPSACKIFEFEFGSETLFEAFWNHQPTYQNTFSSINRDRKSHAFLGAFSENGLLGYLIYAKSTSRIKQFGVAKNFRQSGIGHQLFYEVQQQNPTAEVSLINIDSNDNETIAFLQKIGLSTTVEQFEMVLYS
ncbi:MAG: GNAT family N-acetyltransferase [Flavobacterium sp.]|nr:GNAT family N-acetyltransferase [Flavobacterium sp.]